MWRNARVQKRNQFCLHEGIVVRYIQADDARLAEVAFKMPGQLGALCFFHDEDDVDALNMLGRQRIDSVMIEAGGARFDIGILREHLLGRR